jgi:hypothetical protein
LNKPETNRIVRNKGKSRTNNKEKIAIIASDANWRGSLPPRRRRGACCCSLPLVFGGCTGNLEEKLEVGEDLKAKGLVKS